MNDPFAVIGHQAAEATMLEATLAGRLPAAWIVAGLEGIGKRLLATRFARFLLAGGDQPGEVGLFGEPEPPRDLSINPDHPVSRRVLAGAHGDLKIIERLSDDKRGRLKAEITVDQAREVGRFLSMTAAEGGRRVVLIDEADRLNTNAQNALLKGLEEPPSGSLLMLVTARPGALLPTIRSRCRILKLAPLGEDPVREIIHRRLGSETDGLRIDLAIALAGGSPGRALALLRAGMLDGFDALIALMQDFPGIDPVARERLAERLARPADDAAYRALGTLVPDWLAMLARGEVPAGDPALAEASQRLIGSIGVERMPGLWEKVQATLNRAEAANLDRKQALITLIDAFQAVAPEPSRAA